MTSPGRRCSIAISHASRTSPVRKWTRHRPTNDLPAPGVQHDREIQEPGRRRHEGDVGDPEFIPTHGGEITIHQIRRRSRVPCHGASSSHLFGGDWHPSARRHASGARSACGRACFPWPEARRGSSVTHTSRAKSREQFGPVSGASCLQPHGPMALVPARRGSRTLTRRARAPSPRSENQPDSRS